jgi:hypothetical protein
MTVAAATPPPQPAYTYNFISSLIFLLYHVHPTNDLKNFISAVSFLLSRCIIKVKFLVCIGAMVPPLLNIISIMFITCFTCGWNCSVTISLTVYLLWQAFSWKYSNFYCQTRRRARDRQGHVLDANKNEFNWPIKRC